MGVAGIASSLAAPLIGQIAQNILGNGGAGGPGGLFSSFTSAFSSLLGKATENPLATLLAPIPTLFSTGSMSPQSLNDPFSQLQSGMDRFRDIANVRDHRNGGTGNGGVIVRDHRTGTTSGTIVPPPPSRSASESGLLDQLQSESEQAKQASINDPKSTSKALKAQEAMQALQNVANLLFTQNSILASIKNSAIQGMKVS